MKFREWDPSWGWDDKIYKLRSEEDDSKLFFKSETVLVSNNNKVFKPRKGRLCAGSFSSDLYFGSLSYDLQAGGIDQSVLVYDKGWNQLSEFRPSDFITEPNKYFSREKDVNGNMIIPFRDPALMPNGNLAICTGGWRWNTAGNICEATYTKNKLEIINETIIDDSINFSELERCTFWEDFMFFSVRGALVQNINNEPNRIQVAKRKRNGLYTYFGEIINSDYCYGPSVNNNLLLLFWYQKYYIINNPIKQNLFLKNDQWFLSEDSHKEIELIEMNKLKKQEAGVEITTVPSTSKGIQENIVLNTKNIQPPP